MTDAIEFPPHIERLRPYIAGVPIERVAASIRMEPADVVKLASNENPLGASPLALDALRNYPADLSRYPDADVTELTGALAHHLGVPPSWVVAGAGSESILAIVASMLLCPGRSAVFSKYSFQAFVLAAQRSGAESIEVPSPKLTVDLDALRAAVRPDSAVVYLVNPGNPTGTWLDPSDIAAFIADVPSHVCVILDEAYHEYMPHELRGDSLELLKRHPNLIVTRTFSKAYGLAGLRVGYGVAQPRLADKMRAIRAPFSVTRPAQTAAIAALRDVDFLARTMATNDRARRVLTDRLRERDIESMPSSTNFVLARVGAGKATAARLMELGFIVRPVDNYGLPEWLRISVGTEADMQRLAAILT